MCSDALSYLIVYFNQILLEEILSNFILLAPWQTASDEGQWNMKIWNEIKEKLCCHAWIKILPKDSQSP